MQQSANLQHPLIFSGNGRHAAAVCHMHAQTDKQTDRQTFQKPYKVHVHKADCDCRRTRCGWAQHKQNTNSLEPSTVDRADPQNANVYVGNVSPDVSDAEIRQHFGQFGSITDVKIYRKGACSVQSVPDPPPQSTQLVSPRLS